MRCHCQKTVHTWISLSSRPLLTLAAWRCRCAAVFGAIAIKLECWVSVTLRGAAQFVFLSCTSTNTESSTPSFSRLRSGSRSTQRWDPQRRTP